MAVLANTVETVDVSTIRENLQEDYSMISPEECPFQEMIGSGTTSQKQFDWPVLDLAEPQDDNVVIEGEDAPPLDGGTLAERIYNITQISDKTARISQTAQASDGAANNVQRLDVQVAIKMKELKRDIEVMLLKNQPSVLGSSGVARRTAGFPAFLRTNADITAGAVAPTLSGTTNGYPNTGWTDATALRVFAEDPLNDVIQLCWDSGAEPSVIMLNGGNKRRLSKTFTGSSSRYKDAIDRTLVASIDFYESDFGNLTVVPNRFQPTLNSATDDDNYAVYVIDPEYAKVVDLDPVQRKPLAETGHSIAALVWREYGLQVDNEAAHGIIPDTDNTTG